MPPTDRPPQPPIADNIAVLERALAVIRTVPEAAYTGKSEAVFSASVGEHFRHVIEHYRQFLDGWPNGLVDYDARPRDPRPQTDIAAARAAIQTLCERLRALPADLDLTQPVTVRCSTGPTAPGGGTPSCLHRELLFLHSHSIHHFAFIAILLRQHGVCAAPDFGFAPSTLAHHKPLEKSPPLPSCPSPSG